MNRITTPPMGEIIRAEFIEPMGFSIREIIQKTGIPVSTIQDILEGRQKITIDTSVRLGRLFGVSNRYFFNLQNDIDSRNV